MKKQADFQPLNEPIPEGLEYRQEYWDNALVMIQARERRVLFWRSLSAVLAVLLVGGGLAAHHYWWPADAQAPMAETRVNPQADWAALDTPSQTAQADAFGTASSQPAYTNTAVASTPFAQNRATEASRDTHSDSETSSQSQAVSSSTSSNRTLNSSHSAIAQSADLGGALNTSIPLNTSTPEDTLLEFRLQAPVHPVLAQVDTHEFEVETTQEDSPLKVTDQGALLPLPVLPADVRSNNPTSEATAEATMRKHPMMPVTTFRPLTLSLMLGNSVGADYGSRPGEVGINPSIGVMAEYNRNQTWSFQAGLEYFSIGSMNRSVSTYVTQAELIMQTTTTQVHTERLHYATLPVSVGCRFGRGHQLLWTVGLSYLGQASQRVEVSEEDTFTRNLVESRKDKGYLDGFQTWNAYVAMGYNYSVNPRMAVGGRFQYGLNDITRDDYALFDSHGNDRNSRVLAYVRLNIW